MGRRMKPFAIPNTTMPKKVLYMTLKMYDLAEPIVRIAKKVDIPPWTTLEPIALIATLAL